MSFSTYADLQSQVATWLARSDLTTNIPISSRCLRLRLRASCAFARWKPQRRLRLPRVLGALPTGYLGFRRATWNGSTNVELTYKHPSMLKALYPTGSSGTPKDFTIEASNFILQAVSMIPALTSSTTPRTQW
jgi:hypothetical protein